MTQDVLRVLNERNLGIEQLPISSTALAGLIAKIKSGDMPISRAREVFQTMIDGGGGVAAAMQSLGITAVDESALVRMCRELVSANPRIAADVRGGKQQAIGALVGQAKKRNPNVDPGRVRAICLELIAAGES